MKGDGGQIDYGMRVYDPRVGRFLSVDPLMQKYPWYTPYQFAGNTPIWATDIDGREPKPFNQWGTWINYTDWNSYTSEQKNDINVVNFGGLYGDDKNYIAVRDENDVKKWHYITYEKVVGTLGNVQKGNWALNVSGTNQYEPFSPEGFTADDVEIRQSAKQVGEFGKTYERVIWNTTIFLTTGGLGSSGIFGTSLLGRVGANVFEDVSGQMLSNGMDWKSINLTGLGANALPGWKSNFWTLAGKNALGNTFEFSSSGEYKGVGSGKFSLRNDITSTVIGTAFDVGLDKLRGVAVGLDWQKFTRARSLSYKPKFSFEFKSMDTKYANSLLLRTITGFSGAGIGAGVISNNTQEAVKLKTTGDE